MTDQEKKIHVLDAAYKPFLTFAEWASRSSVDSVRWDRYKGELENKRDVSDEALRRAREVVKRAAALDTGAIEGLYEVDRGFTFTVAFETAAWEVQLAQKGEKVRSLFEAQMHAYDYVLDLATKSEPISEAAIRVLHEVVCRAQDTYRVMTAVGPQEQELVKGRYKVLPNHVRTRDGVDHSYAPVDVTPAEMQRLVEEMRSEAFLSAHPVMQAAYAHYALVVIHPFPDGNGRVARALASAFTYRAISMPIMILSEQKSAYLDSLEEADRGEFQAFVSFISERALDTMTLVKESLQGAYAQAPQEGAAVINDLYRTKGGYGQNQVDEAGRGLVELLITEIGRSIAKVAGSNLQGDANSYATSGNRVVPNVSHRPLLREDRDLIVINVEIRSSPPAAARVNRQFAVFLPRDANTEDDVLLSVTGNTTADVLYLGPVVFSARVGELIPTISAVFHIKAGMFADRLVGEMLADLKPLVKKSLHGDS